MGAPVAEDTGCLGDQLPERWYRDPDLLQRERAAHGTLRVSTRTAATSRFSSAAYLGRLLDEMDHAQISLRIRDARKLAGLTQEQLAELMTVHVNTIGNWENPREGNVPFDRTDELAAVLNVEKRWLLHGDEQPHSGADDERISAILLRLESLEAKVDELSTLEDLRQGLEPLRQAIESLATRRTRPKTDGKTGTDD